MPKSTTGIGKQAEAAVAKRLAEDGYEILGQNWRTRLCEIDIVAKKDKVVHFVEVKHRLNDNQGGGLEAITTAKLKQMAFAAELWASQNDWQGDSLLMVADVAGDNFSQIELVALD